MSTPVTIPTLAVTRDGGALPSGASGAEVVIETNDGNVVVLATNDTGSPVTIALQTQATIAGLAVSDVDVVISAHSARWVGPFPPAIFNDALGLAHITDGSGGALTFQALRF